MPTPGYAAFGVLHPRHGFTSCRLAGGQDASEGGGPGDGAGAGVLEATDPHAAQCVFQILHDALREVVSGFLDAADSVPEHELPELSAAPQLPLVGEECPPAPEEHTNAGPVCASQEPKLHASRGTDGGEKVTAIAVPGEEDLGGGEMLELSRQPHAAAFVEYVFERMIFGLLQELVAPVEVRSDGG